MLASDIIPSLNMERFSRFSTHKVMLLTWNHGLIHFPIVAKNHGFLYAGGLLFKSIRYVSPLRSLKWNAVVDVYKLLGINGFRFIAAKKQVGCRPFQQAARRSNNDLGGILPITLPPVRDRALGQKP